MKKKIQVLQESLDMKTKDNRKLSGIIERMDEKVRSLERTIDMMNPKAAQEKCEQLEQELNEAQMEVELLTIELAEMQEKMKVRLFKLGFDVPRDSLKYIAISVSALALLLVVRKIM